MSDIFKNNRDINKGKLSKKGTELYEVKIDKLLKESLTEIKKIQTHLKNNKGSDIYRDL